MTYQERLDSYARDMAAAGNHQGLTYIHYYPEAKVALLKVKEALIELLESIEVNLSTEPDLQKTN